MSAPDLLIRDHRLAQIANGALAAALVMQLGEEHLAGRVARDELVAALVAADLLTHQAAVRLAAQFVMGLRAAEGVDGQVVEAEFDGGASFGRASGTLDDLDQARARTLTERDWEAEYWRIVEGLAVRADRAAKMSGRRTVIASAEASERGWRRVSDGNPCAFCAMLIGRGPVYTSKASASRVVGRGKTPTPRGSRRLGEQFHNHCGCSVVEQIGPWTPTPDEQRLVDLYEANAGGSTDEVLARMRADGQGVINDAHKPQTQTGGAGGGMPPARTIGMASHDGPDEFPTFNGWTPPMRRSEIERFDEMDAEILLDGDGSGHGMHRAGTGAGKAEFPYGWAELDVVEWVNTMVDRPVDGKPLNDGGMVLFGTSRGVDGVVFVRMHSRWWITTAYPEPMEQWGRVRLD